MNLLRKTSLKSWLATFFVAIAMMAAYANSFHNGFHFDDFHTIVDNPSIRSLRHLPDFFWDATSFSVLPANRTYRPFVSASLALDYSLGHGYIPFWFHFGTFIFFIGEVLLLSALYELLLDKTIPSGANHWIALAGAAWYGLHPAMAETINYIIQRGDLYCTLGCVAALYLFARYRHLRRTGLYLLPLGFALLSKPPAGVFAILLFLYVFFFEAETRRIRTSLVAAVPSVVLTCLLLWLQAKMTPKSFTPSILSPWQYRVTQPYVLLRYVGALFLPLHLNVDTDLRPFDHLDARALTGILFIILLAAAIWISARRRTLYPITYGLLWFVVTQLPTSLYPLSEVENDHRMFFSFVGLILAAVWSAWLLLLRLTSPQSRMRARPAIVVLSCLVLAGYGYGVHRRNAVWRDEESLWRDDVEKSPENGRGLMNFGTTQMNKGLYAVALASFERAQTFTPNYPTLEINLGVVRAAMGDAGDAVRGAQAEASFERAIALAPKDDSAHAFYGRWLNQHGRSTEAVPQLQQAVALNPTRVFQRDLLIDAYLRTGLLDDALRLAQATLTLTPDDSAARQVLDHPPAKDASYWVNLSLTQYRQSRYPESIESARRALQLDPHIAEAYNNLGADYGAMRRWDEAIWNEREALRLQPGLQIAQNNLSAFLEQRDGKAKVSADDLLNESLRLYQAGRYEESIVAARGVLRLNPGSAEAWNNIAADDEALHRWDAAIEEAKMAVALKPGFQLARNNLAWSLAQKKLAEGSAPPAKRP